MAIRPSSLPADNKKGKATSPSLVDQLLKQLVSNVVSLPSLMPVEQRPAAEHDAPD